MNEVELGARAFGLVATAGVLCGIASLWVFRRCSDGAKLRAAVNRIVAHLFELRLFSDEPLLVMRAQRDLLAANGEFLRQTIGPSLVLLVPFAFLLIGMNDLFGRAPLQPGKPAVVTVQLKRGDELSKVQLQAPAGIQIETPPVRVPRLAQVSWRVRPTRMVRGVRWRLEPAVQSITVEYPRATIFDENWVLWFSVAFLAGTLGYALTLTYLRH